MDDCIFCRIIRGEIPADIVYEDDDLIAFKDIAPLAPTHVLVVPKFHVDNLDLLPADDLRLAGTLMFGIKKVAGIIGVTGGYKVVTNCGSAAGQVVGHLHFHILAGKSFKP